MIMSDGSIADVVSSHYCWVLRQATGQSERSTVCAKF